MSSLTVITFDGVDDAGEVWEAMSDLERRGLADVKDAALVIKDATGKVSTRGRPSDATMTGAAVGGVLGGLLTFFFPPAGIALGAAGGALVGKTLEENIDRKFVEEVKASLKLGSSAIFLLYNGDETPIVAALRPYQGHLYHTNVTSDIEEALRRALE